MTRRAIFLVPLLSLLLLTSVHPAQAGGWAAVALDEDISTAVVNEPVTITFRLMQHGVSPFPGGDPVLTAVHRETGEELTADAVETIYEPPGEGHYSVRVTFPTIGDWIWSISHEPFPGSTSFTPMVVTSVGLDVIRQPDTVHIAAIAPGSCDTPDLTQAEPLMDVQRDAKEAESATAVKTANQTLKQSTFTWLEKPHVLAILASKEASNLMIACGDLTSATNIPLLERHNSGYGGIATLASTTDQTTLSIMLAQGLGGELGPDPAVATTHSATTVSMMESAFSPNKVAVAVGESVTWVNQTQYLHEVAFDDMAINDSGILENGEDFTVTFTKPGTYTFQCGPHAFTGMYGTVVVS